MHKKEFYVTVMHRSWNSPFGMSATEFKMKKKKNTTYSVVGVGWVKWAA